MIQKTIHSKIPLSEYTVASIWLWNLEHTTFPVSLWSAPNTILILSLIWVLVLEAVRLLSFLTVPPDINPRDYNQVS